jgi:hypothetical protein
MANERRLLEQARVQRVRFGVVNRATARLLTDIALAKSEAREVAGL